MAKSGMILLIGAPSTCCAPWHRQSDQITPLRHRSCSWWGFLSLPAGKAGRFGYRSALVFYGSCQGVEERAQIWGKPGRELLTAWQRAAEGSMP